MNFFFGIKNNIISSKISIPKFQNSGKLLNDVSLYQAFIKNNTWNIKKVDCKQNDSFFFIENDIIENDKIFFLGKDHEINSINKNNELYKINNFTNTSPTAFRANLQIYSSGGGFSSYQSEYPYEMSTRKGSIMSPVSMLLNNNSDLNYIFFKNIYFKPKQDESFLYFINIKEKKVIDKINIKLNYLNEIKVDKNIITRDIYIFTNECLGIPLYVSIKDSHISFEHTHPPHHYILSDDRYKTIAKIKNEFKEIVDK